MKKQDKPKPIQADIIQHFPTKFLKHKKKIDKEMKLLTLAFCEKENISGVIWGYADHYDKACKNKPTWHVCFSNEESKINELAFWYSRKVSTWNGLVCQMLRNLKLIK